MTDPVHVGFSDTPQAMTGNAFASFSNLSGLTTGWAPAITATRNGTPPPARIKPCGWVRKFDNRIFEGSLMLRVFSCASMVLLAAVPMASAQNSAIPGKFYEYYTVASTQSGTFTAVGPPSINDNGLCAFTGTTSAGQTIWVSDGHLIQPKNINPGQANLGETSSILNYRSTPTIR